MIERAAVVAEARQWLGTRFHHQAAIKGIGCDCIGLVRGVAQSLGLFDPANFERYAGYARRPSGGQLETGCYEFLRPLEIAAAGVGDIVLFRFDGAITHAAILGDYPEGGLSVIHAYAPADKVIETRYSEPWARRAALAFGLPGVA